MPQNKHLLQKVPILRGGGGEEGAAIAIIKGTGKRV